MVVRYTSFCSLLPAPCVTLSVTLKWGDKCSPLLVELGEVNEVGAPAVAQWDWRRLGSRWDTDSVSWAWPSGLRIWRPCSFSLGRDFGSALIPGPGAPYAAGWRKMKRKKEVNEIIQVYLAHKCSAGTKCYGY